MVIGTGAVYFVVVALKPISNEFDWPRAIPSTAYALQYFGGGIGGIFMGYCLDRAGLGIPALLGACMIGIGAILTAHIEAPWHLYLIYGVMMGFLGRAALFTPLTANITRWFEHKKSVAVGIVGSGQALAGAVWPPIFQHFFNSVGWRETATWYGVFCLLTMLPLVLILRQKPPAPSAYPHNGIINDHEVVRGEPRQIMSANRLQLILMVASIGCCVAMALPLAHLVAHVSDLGHDSARGAEILSVTLTCAAIGSFFGVGFLGQRFGGLCTLFIFSVTQMLFLLALAFSENLITIYLVAAMFGVGYGGILPSYPVIVREYLPSSEAGRRTAIIILSASGGMAIGSWLGGTVFDLTGSYNPAFLIGVVFNFANLVIIGALILRLRSRTIGL
ncbi:MAG: MFS transporter [Rhodospirillaceae bacterium]|nr:MFS transporter [Rhodospirillaceae bacterium]